jgi:hypothetical protein
MKTTTKILIRISLVIALLFTGFAAGFPVGKSIGFTTGSEWALVQADILAREAGTSMPVYFQEGQFRVIVKQPRHLYKQAWQLADRYYNEMENVNRGARPLIETVYLSRNMHITQ